MCTEGREVEGYEFYHSLGLFCDKLNIILATEVPTMQLVRMSYK